MGNEHAAQTTTTGEQNSVAHDKVGGDELATMSIENVAAAVEQGRLSAEQLVVLRPSIVGDVTQIAIREGKSHATQALMGQLHARFLQAGGVYDDLVFRSILRLEGPEAPLIQAAVGLSVGLGDAAREKVGMHLPKPLQANIVDERLLYLRAAGSDPGWAQIISNYYDRPEAAAAQLLHEYKKDRKAFHRHKSELEGLFVTAPAPGRDFVHAIMALAGADTAEVKIWVMEELNGAIAAHVRADYEGQVLIGEPFPKKRAEQLIPLLAEMVSQPDVAEALVTLNRRHRSLGAAVPSLPSVMRTILDSYWENGVRKQVMASLSDGATQMFQNSVKERDPVARRARTLNAANFVGQAALAEHDVGLRESSVKIIGELLQGASNVVPGPVGKGVKYAGKGLEYVGHDEKATITASSLEELTRMVYESLNQRPKGDLTGQAVQRHEDELLVWQTDAMNEFSRIGVK